MTTHEWKESTDEGIVFYRANHHAGRWNLYRRPKDDPGWIALDPPELADVKLLHAVLQRKYQRRNVPYAHLEQVGKWIEEFAP